MFRVAPYALLSSIGHNLWHSATERSLQCTCHKCSVSLYVMEHLCFIFTLFWAFMTFLKLFYCYSITVVPIVPPRPSSAHHNSHSHSQFPHCCPRPQVLHTCSLSSPFPLFPFLPPLFRSPSPLVTSSLFHVSLLMVLLCSLLCNVH